MITFTTQTITGFTASPSFVNQVAWNGSVLVAVGTTGTVGLLSTSVDGTTWVSQAITGLPAYNIRCIAWNGSYWLAGGQATSLASALSVSTTTFPTSWTSITANISASIGGSVNSLGWNGRTWVAAGQNSNATVGQLAYISTTSAAAITSGTTWSSSAPPTSIYLLGVAWNGTVWIVVGAKSATASVIFTGPSWLIGSAPVWTLRAIPATYVQSVAAQVLLPYVGDTGTTANFLNPGVALSTAVSGYLTNGDSVVRLNFAPSGGTTIGGAGTGTGTGIVFGINGSTVGNWTTAGLALNGAGTIASYTLDVTGTARTTSNTYLANSGGSVAIGTSGALPAFSGLAVTGGLSLTNGYRPLYSNVTTSPLTTGAYGYHYNITSTAVTAITIGGTAVAADSNAYWVFRNNTGSYLSITVTYSASGGGTGPLTIPPGTSTTLMYLGSGSGSAAYVFF